MVDFISEVQEELRKDDYNRWLKKYGPYLAAVIVLIVAGTGYYQWDIYQKQKTSEKMSFDYIEILDSVGPDNSKAIAGFKSFSETAPSGYAGISLMRAAELELESGQSEQAVVLFDQAAATFTKKRHIQLAQLKAAYVLAGNGNFEDVKRRVEPLIVKDEPYEYLARELMALAAVQTGDLQAARMQLAYIENDPGAPQSLAARAKQTQTILNNQTAETTIEQPMDDQNEEEAVAPVETDPNE